MNNSTIFLWLQRNGIGKGSIFVMMTIFLIILGLVGSSVYTSFQKNFTLNETEVIINIPNSIKIEPEVTIYNAAYDLEAQGIMNAKTFQYKVERESGWKIHSRTIKGGIYTIPPKIHYKDLMKILGIDVKD